MAVPSGSGNGKTCHGASASMRGFHADTSLAMHDAKALSGSTRSEMTHASTHWLISTPSGHAGSLDSSTMPAPTSSSCHSEGEIRPALRWMAEPSMNEKRILCSEKRARDTFV